MARPTTRVLAVLDLLQSHNRLSGAELARRIGVDVRTLRRYIVMLEELGIPITSERGRYGAYSLVAGFKLPPMVFTNDEAVALAVGMVAARGLGLAEGAPAVESAQAKLTRVLPDKLKRHVLAIAETVKVDQLPNTGSPASNAALMVLTSAAQSRQRVHLQYRAGQGQHSERDFDPYGLAWHAGAWYALGMCHLRNDLRSFRLDRVLDVRPLDQYFRPAQDFDPLAHLLRSIAGMPRGHAIEVLLRTDLATARKNLALTLGIFELAKGGVLLRSSADDLDWFTRRLAGLPFDFEIRKPLALRRALARCATRLASLARTGANQ